MWEQLGSLGQTALVVLTLASVAGFGLQRGHTANLEKRLTEERTHSDRCEKRAEELEEEGRKKDAQIETLTAIKTNEAVLHSIDGRLAAIADRLNLPDPERTTPREP